MGECTIVMRNFYIATLIATFAIVCSAAFLSTTHCAAADARAVGIAKRVPWTTSRVKGSPEPPLPYVTERVFPALKFNRCLDISAALGSDRLSVLEERGKIFSFPNDPKVKSADLVIDLAKDVTAVTRVYALAFHPKFKQNRFATSATSRRRISMTARTLRGFACRKPTRRRSTRRAKRPSSPGGPADITAAA
jgi:hypothetical protein